MYLQAAPGRLRHPTASIALFLFAVLITLPHTSRASDPPGALSQWHQKSARKFTRPAAPLDPTIQINSSPALRRHLFQRPSRKPAVNTHSPGTLLARRQKHLAGFDAARKRHRKASEWQITWNADNGTPAFISGPLPTHAAKRAAGASTTDIARLFIGDHRDLFGLENPDRELHPRHKGRDALGREHLVFERHHQGIPLWGHDLAMHFDARGSLYAVNARYAPTLPPIATTPTLDADAAIAIAAAHLSAHLPVVSLPDWARQIMDYDGPQVRQYIWVDEASQYAHLIWHVQIRPNLRDRWYYFVDAHTGAILESYNATHGNGPTTATAADLSGALQTIHVYEQDNTFYMIDASRPIFNAVQPDPINNPRGAVLTKDARGRDLRAGNTSTVTSQTNAWSDPTAVSAHINTGLVFDYFFAVHDRRGIDNQDGSMISIVHVTDRGRPMDNAFWNGKIMAYGDGDALFTPLPGALDVAAHEMTHGVIERTVPLEYRFQSGALNESFADVFAAMVDRDDWQIGEDIIKGNSIPSGALRDMADPHNGASTRGAFWQPAHMDEFVELDISQDNGGVHVNSGIANRVCFLIAEAIGRDKTEQIYYRILDARYLNTRARFTDLRLAALRAASDLFGGDAPEGDTIAAAFDAVGIFGTAPPTQAPRDLNPVDGEEWIVVVGSGSLGNGLYLTRPSIDSEVVLLTDTPVRTISGNSISVSDDGSLILFIDARDFIRSIKSDGSEEEIISRTGEWASISLSPDGQRLAAARSVQDSTLYIFDLEDPQANKAIHLYNPTTQEGVRAEITLFADAMDWDFSGQFVLFDAFNSIPQASGDAIEFWNVNVLDVENELILPVFPALPEGISMGNPSFAQTNDNFFAFDLVDLERRHAEIWAADLFRGTANRIGVNGSTISFPKYSPDDSELIFQREIENEGVYTVRRVPLADDKISVAGPSEEYLRDAQLPTWFTIGKRPEENPTDVVEQENGALPAIYRLQQNYPNPFNAATVLRYSLPYGGEIEVAVYDLLGRRVLTLEAGFKATGEHAVSWDGKDASGRSVASGAYFYRLQATAPEGTQIHRSRKMTLLR